MQHFEYRWNLSDVTFTRDKGKVFSCFSCGGGSSFGYKLAGFDVIGNNEIDPRMNKIYIENQHPKYSFCEPIQDFKNREDLPAELYQLDILDGSPPCSAFSISGDREDCWGKEKKFREGQAKQVLDTLFFDFIDLAKKLQPKVVIAENVKGLLISQAIKYVTRIYNEFDEAGYYVTHNCVNMAKMGVPQKRERVFFLAIRKDLIEKIPYEQELFTKTPLFDWNFNEPEIPFRDVFVDYCDKPLSEATKELWNNRQPGDIDLSYIIARNRGVKSANSRFNFKFLYSDKVANTLAATDCCVLFDRPRYRNRDEIILCSTFPMDYNFLDQKPEYVCGMSVPPVGMAHLSSEVYNQWLSKL